MNHSSKTNLTIEISKVRGSSNNPREQRLGEEEGAVGIEHMHCCGSPARDRLPGRQAQGPFYEDALPPNIGKCFNPKLKVKKKKKEKKQNTQTPQTTQP